MDTLKIFVSGTMIDMKVERDTVARAIASLWLDAVRAETEFSEDSSSRDKVVNMTRDCDIYLGLYNQTRYGSIIPEDGISATELEFIEAQRLHKPTLIFVKQLPKNWAPQRDEEKDERETQKAFVNRVLDFERGKFRAPEFETLTQLENQVVGSLMTLLVQHFKISVTRPPNQKSGPPEELLNVLTEWITVNYKLNIYYHHWKTAELGRGIWPGEHMETANREEQLYMSLRIRFDDSDPRQADALNKIAWFRSENSESIQNWDERRNQLLSDIRAAWI